MESFNKQRFEEITKLYLLRAPINQIINLVETVINESETFVYYLLKATINHEIAEQYPASKKYRLAYLKKLINLLESKINLDIGDEIYQLYTSLLSSHDEESINYSSYKINEKVITVEDYDDLVTQGTTGLHSWEAGKRFISYALDNQQLFVGQKILELGSGVGLTGIAINKLINHKFYYFSDCDPNVISLIKRNTLINECENFKIIHFTWEDTNDEIKKILQTVQPDLIIGSDLIYDLSLIEPLFNVIITAISLNIKVILLSTDRKTGTPFILEEKLNNCETIKWTKQIINTKDSPFYYSESKIDFFLYKINF